MKVGIVCSRIRLEEKLLLQAFQDRGVEIEIIDDRQLVLDTTKPSLCYDIVVGRSLNYSRGLYAQHIFEHWGVRTINPYKTLEICGDKLLTTTALQRAGIPTPRTVIAFTPESALEAIEEIGYPVVLKPLVGSWGRLLAKINDRDAAEAVLEHKSELGNYQHSIFYIQEFIRKPNRDIRAAVIGDRTVRAIYRAAPHWITNTARGGEPLPCPITPELDRLCVAAAKAVGGGIVGVDLLEDPERGLLVNEVNGMMEFGRSAHVTEVDLPGEVADYVIGIVEGRYPYPGEESQQEKERAAC
ncbi:MAG: lysine biosynthesis protein LysX [Anaerolineae bacterium]